MRMTEREAIEWLNNLIETMKSETSEYLPHPEYKDEVYEALDVAIESLKQESILDKVKVEIDLETRIQVKHYTNTDAVIDAVLDVIDEYKVEEYELSEDYTPFND